MALSVMLKPAVSFRFSLALAATASVLASAAATGAAAEPDNLHARVRDSGMLPFDQLQRRVRDETAGEYMGVQFDPAALVYRFRFLQDGTVVNVDVNARTGERVRRRQSY